MKNIVRVLLIWCTATLLVCNVNAQDSIKDSERAPIIFDVDIQKLRKDPFFKSVPIEKMLQDEGMIPPEEMFDAKSVIRIYGAFQFPKSMEDVMGMGPNSDLPFNFFVRVGFADGKSLNKIYEEVSRNAGKVEKNGKTYLTAPEGEGPSNFFIHKVDEKTLEFGTDKYVFNKDRKVLTKSVEKLWKKIDSNTAVRVAYDVEASRKFLTEAMDMIMEESPMGEGEIAMFKEVVSFVKDVRVASLGMDLASKKMLELISESKDAKGATAVKETLDGLLYIARTGGKAGIKQMPIKDKAAVGAMTDIVNQLKAKQKDNVVSITINRPENFDEAMKGFIVEMQKQQAKLEKMNNFRQFAIAVHTYHDSYKGLPFNLRDGSRMSKDLSWRVRVMPFMELNNIYDQMDASKPWDHETNKKWASKMPKMLGKDGKNTSICWVKSDMQTLEQIANADGTSNTIMLIENPKGVPWTQSKDISVLEAVKMVKNLKDGQELVVVMYDASARTINNKIKRDTLKALLTPGGGEVIDDDPFSNDRPRPRPRFNDKKEDFGRKVEGKKIQGGKRKKDVGKKAVGKEEFDKHDK